MSARDLTDGDPLLTTAEVASLFRVDSKTVTRWCEERILPAILTPGGGKWLVRESVVRAHLEGGTP